MIELVVRLNDQLTNPIDKVQSRVAGFQARLGVLAAGAAVGVASAFAAITVEGFKAADAIGDAADRAGIAVESMSRLKFVADQNDVEFSALTIALKKYQVVLSEASGGQKEASNSLKLLGLSASQLKNLKVEDQLRIIADQFRRIKNPADQTRIAVELFGRSGEQLVPLLRQGGSAIEALTKEADELGITLDGRTVRAIDAADKALKKLKATISAFGSGVAGNIALAILGPQDNVDAALQRLEELQKRRDAILTGRVRVPGPERNRILESLNAQIKGAEEGLKVIQAMEQEIAAGAARDVPGEFVPIDEVRVTAQKKNVEGLAKVLRDYEEQTRTSLQSANLTFERTQLQLNELLKNQAITVEQYTQRLKDATIQYNEAVLIDPVVVTAQKKITSTLTKQQQAIKAAVGTVQEGLFNLAQSGELTGKAILRYLLSAFTSKLLYKAIENLGSALIKALSTSSGSGSGFGNFLNGLLGAFGYSAGGGRMSGPRIVGEEGPELLLGNGTVMNRRQMQFAMAGMGGTNVTFGDTNIVVQGNADDRALQIMEQRIRQSEKRTFEQWNRLMKDNYGKGLR